MNPAGTEKSIYRLSAICGVVAALAFIIPRLMPDQEGAFGPGTAVLVFLGMLAGAAVLSLYLFLFTIQVYREISILPRLAGIGTSVVLVTVLAMLLGFLRF